MPRRRRLRRPVFSRLTWAWLSAGGVTAVAGAMIVNAALNPGGLGRIALPVGDIQHIAPTPEAPPQTREEMRLAAPALRGLDAEEEEQAPEILLYPEEESFFEGNLADLSADDFVITINGERQGATPAAAAALEIVETALPIPEPDPAMMRATPLGKVPRIAADGRMAVNYYARAYQGDGAKPRIALIVGGLGLNPTLTERAIVELPPDVSLAFAPYAKDLDFWTRKAREAGHEILIELPMEGYGPNQEALGAAALLSSRTPAENLQRLDWLMSRFGGYFAATNYMGARFSTDAEALIPVLEKLREAGVGYIDDTGAAGRAARAAGAKAATVNRTIPPAIDNAGRDAVRRELRTLERIAEEDGAALAKTYAHEATIDEIARWTAQLEANGFATAPASAVLRARAATR